MWHIRKNGQEKDGLENKEEIVNWLNNGVGKLFLGKSHLVKRRSAESRQEFSQGEL